LIDLLRNDTLQGQLIFQEEYLEGHWALRLSKGVDRCVFDLLIDLLGEYVCGHIEDLQKAHAPHLQRLWFNNGEIWDASVVKVQH
jgi:hypothetical protein